MLDELFRTPHRVADRLAVAGIDDTRCQLDRALERVEVIAQWIGAALGIQADRRRDRLQEMIAADQHAVVAQETDVPVRMSWQLDDLPGGKRAALVQQVRAACIPDEGRERMALLDQLVGIFGRDAVLREPVRHALGPVVGTPDPLALRVVEPALVDRRAGRGSRGRGAADMVWVEVRDGDALDTCRGPRHVAEAEARVEERAAHEVAMDVLRAGRERQRQPPNTVFELYERLFYTSC